MPLFRLLAIALLSWIAYLVLKNFLRQVRQVRQVRQRAPAVSRRRSDFTKVLRCQRCGIHVPEDEAVYREGKVYCSEQHSR